jgi:PAS domain S-box-containing protein
VNQPANASLRRFFLDRHLAPVLTAVFAGVLISTLVAYFYTKHTVENLAEGQIAQAMSFLDREVTSQVHDMTTQTWLMSQEEAFRLSMEDSYLGRSARVTAQHKLVGYVSGGALDRAHLIGRNGQQILSSDPKSKTLMDLADRSYFMQAVRGIPSIATIPVSKITGKPILLAANPLRGQDGTVSGVVTGVIDTNNFAKEMLREARIGDSGGAYILSAEGQVLASPQGALPTAFASEENASDILTSLTREGTHYFKRDGAPRIGLSHRNKVTGWILVVEADEGEVLAPATRLAAVSGTISFFTLALVALALGTLRRVMTNLRKSEADHRTLTELSPMGIATFGPTGTLEYLNKQARIILGLAPETPLPDNITLQDPGGQPLAGERSPIATVLRERTSVIGQLTWYTLPDGTEKALDLNATLLAAEDREAHGVVATLEDITERIQSLELLHQSEERFSSLFRLSPDSIVLSELETGVIVDVNETFTETHGVSREDIIGKTIEEINLYPDAVQRRDIMERVKRDGHALNVEILGRGKGGAAVYLSLSSQVMDIGDKRYGMTVARDITERIHTEEELRENRRLLESILNTVPISIFWKDKNCVFLGCNAAFAHTLGKSGPQDIIGKTDFDLPMSSEQSTTYRADDLYVMSTLAPKLHYVEPLSLGDGKTIWLDTSKLPLLDDAGQAVGLLGMFEDITERILAEQELRENRRLLESILNTVPMAIFWTDRTSTFLGCNQTFAETIGLGSPQAVVGLTELTLPVPQERREMHKNDNEEVMRTLKPKLRFLEPRPMPNGDTNMLEVSKLPILDDEGKAVGLLGMFEDITERVRAVEKLIQSEERFSRLFRLSPEPIVLIDAETKKIADANEAFSNLSGYNLGSVIGHDTLELGLYADPAMRDNFYRAQDREGHVENMEFEGRRKDGQSFICSLSGQAMEIGAHKYLLVMMRDVTEIKKMQEMMIQTEKMISVGGIAAGIAHEINNPLGIVLQAAQNLVQRTRSDFKKNVDVAEKIGFDMNLMQTYMRERKLDVFIEDIQSAAVRASAIIRHMLDFSRSSESRRKVCDIPGIIDKAVALAGSDYDLKKSYDFKRIKIGRDYADDLPVVNCTETEIEQVLLNILRNAAQALASGESQPKEPRIDIRVWPTADSIRIEVADNGPGMPPEVERRVFEPFYTTKPPGVGTGLGLSVSYFIVTKGHGGKMSVSSQLGMGTVFSIDLPRDDAKETQDAP